MTLPNFPTDTLYKFCTTCGVGVIVAGVLAINGALHTAETVPRELSAVRGVVDEAADAHLELLIEDLDTRLERAIAERSAAAADTQAQAQSSVQALFDSAFKARIERLRIQGQRESQSDLIMMLQLRLDAARGALCLGALLVLVGLSSTFWGLMRWYSRQQVLLDRMLIEQLGRVQSVPSPAPTPTKPKRK